MIIRILNVLYFMFIVVWTLFFTGFLLARVIFPTLDFLENFALSMGMSLLIISIIGEFLQLFGLFNYLCLMLCLFLYTLILIAYIIFNRRKSFNLVSSTLNLYYIWYLLCVLIISVLGVLVRLFPSRYQSLLCGGWIPGNHIYPVLYMIRFGKYLYHIYHLNIYANTINNVVHERFNIITQASIFILLRLTNVWSILYLNKFMPIYGVFLLPLSAVAVSSKCLRSCRNLYFSFFYCIIIYFVACFATHKIIVDGRFMLDYLIIGYSMILYTIYFMLDNKCIRSKLFLLLFSISIYLFYYTAGLIFLIIIITLIFIQEIYSNKIISKTYVLWYIVTYISYYLFLDFRVYSSFISTLKEAMTHFGVLKTQSEIGRAVIHVGMPFFCAYLNLFLILVVVLIFLIKFRNKVAASKYVYLNYMIIFGLGVVSVFLYSWEGVKALARLGAYIIAPLILSLCSIIKYGRDDERKLILFVVIVAAILAIFAYIPGKIVVTGYLNYPEEKAVMWYMCFNDSNYFVFTDSRLGTSTIVFNFFKFTGIGGNFKFNPTSLKNFLEIYYSNNPLRTKKVLEEYNSKYFLFDSKLLSFGIPTLNLNYKPTNASIMKKYYSNYFSCIYSNGQCIYFMCN